MQALKGAKFSIDLQIYDLSDPSILALLKQKQDEGVAVTIFHDKKRNHHKDLSAYPVNSSGGLMHRKILVIDEVLVLLGTANFTTQSLKMHDNLIAGIWNRELAKFLKDSIDGDAKFDGGITAFLLPDFEGKCLETLSHCIDGARDTIQVAMFTLTHPGLVSKLAQAQGRGVAVSVAIDRYTAMGASQKAIAILQNAGAEILLNRGSQLLHHKWAIIDGKTLAMGSANWTAAAFAKNQDCLLILESLSASQQKILKKIWKEVAIASEKM